MMTDAGQIASTAGRDLPEIKIERVGAAPVVRGRELGPCALHDGVDWVLGYWNGDSWWTIEGDPITPLVFVVLPRLTL
jgi:hypothetical protein